MVCASGKSSISEVQALIIFFGGHLAEILQNSLLQVDAERWENRTIPYIKYIYISLGKTPKKKKKSTLVSGVRK